MKLEQVVRPFQEGDVFTARRLPTVELPIDYKEPISITIGKPGTLHAKAIGIRNLEGGGRFKETSRVVEEVRVENPEDPNQYVIIERINSMKLLDEETNMELNLELFN